MAKQTSKPKPKPKPKRSAAEIAKAMLGAAKAKPTAQPTRPAKSSKSAAKSAKPAEKSAKRGVTAAKPAAPRATAPSSPAASRSLPELLEASRLAVTRSDLPAALALLLDAWHLAPAAEVATAIERVGARAQTRLAPPGGKTAKLRDDAWNAAALAGDPVMRGVLVDTVSETKGSAYTLERIELLVKHHDPRVSTCVVRLIETPIYNASVSRTTAFWKRMFQLLSELGDPRIVAQQRGFAVAWDANRELNEPERPVLKRRLQNALPDIEAAYSAGPSRLAAADVARCAAIIAALDSAIMPDSEQNEQRLLAEIYAAPDDDHVRMVYADWLQERAEPRGELIMLQLARARGEEPTADQARREAELLEEHGKRWLGPLVKAVNKQGMEYERGFLTKCAVNKQLEPVQAGGGFAYGAVMDSSPGWATVREVTGAVPASDDCKVPSLRALLELESPHIAILASLTRPLAVERLSWIGPCRNFEVAAFTQIRVLPALRVLELVTREASSITPEDLARLVHAPACAKLESLVLAVDHRRLPTWIDAVAASSVLRLEIRGESSEWSWPFVVERDRANRLSRLSIRVPGLYLAEQATQAIEALEELPATALTSLHITISSPGSNYDRLRERLDIAIAALQLEQPVVIDQLHRK